VQPLQQQIRPAGLWRQSVACRQAVTVDHDGRGVSRRRQQ
jgi:hypothetical protein